MGFKKILKPHHNPFTVEVKLQFHKAFRVWHIYMHSSAFFVENHFILRNHAASHFCLKIISFLQLRSF